MNIPDLSGLITKEDVNHINMGNRQIDYTSWAKVSQLLKQHAPGWEFNLRQSESSNFVWAAPNGTGFFVCYFTNPEKEATADFPFPIMDHRNNPIKFAEISARVLTDNHRRALCACACFTFALAHEMWSQEEVQDTALRSTVTTTQPQRPLEVRDPSKPVIHEGFGKRLDEDEKKTIINLIRAFNEEYPAKQNYLMEEYHKKWLPNTELKPEKYWSKNLHFVKQAEFIATLTEQVKKELTGVNF
tara:strand:+ start:140 stop:871 length:732 start_codon:yes stop_codon:yes gene_type:complete